ncbi:hypothetical protein LMG7974_00157 [Campylobacter majalis]|uniref:Glycosyltransferase 2-like domain-containing protein n=1 Tax=Campylobacter majalis TaxID=2790656 RepID=A0ABM8Q2E9_9BACT|nr:glycosyltransferase family 2 protein [Campylobacter majalis]CAD7286934.1 hypothetical protein LMG7974_00157 [Campylobacter majalis]
MYKLAFLIPHFNHSTKLAKMIEILKKYECDILIVDDASKDEHKDALNQLNVSVLYRQNNGGKGAAFKDGIRHLSRLGFTHVLQIDADMQHDLSVIDEFIKLSKLNPCSLVCGAPKYGNDAPKSRLYGRKITNFWVAINTLNMSIKDAMCGFRIYPVDLTLRVISACRADRMDFDIEILYLLLRSDANVIWMDVKVCYDSDGVSHFRAFRDNLAISKTHAKYFLSLPKYFFKKVMS